MENPIAYTADAIAERLPHIRESVHIVEDCSTHYYGIVLDSEYTLNDIINNDQLKHVATLPPLFPEWLGDKRFLDTHQVRFPYMVGEMANGIATAECTIQAARAGFVGSFGAGGLTPDVIEKNIHTIKNALGDQFPGWGANLIHSPNEPTIEATTVDLFLREGVRRVSASAFMSLSPHIVRYAFSGLYLDQQQNICRTNHVMAKISHPDVAKHFMQPVPQKILTDLLEKGFLTKQEVKLAQHLPIAEDITAESDSGGHTDNRPLMTLFPIIKKLAIDLSEQYNYQTPIRVGAAGGLGTPDSIAAAFAMGAAYVLTGTINESAVEAGVCAKAKEMLAQADFTDVEMAPAADMFELGVRLQVLKRGTMFSRRAIKLYDIYKKYASINDIPADEKTLLETQIFKQDLDTVWQSTREYFQMRDPHQVEHADKDEKYRMALVFRSYLGQSSRWAIVGDESRVLDYQIWCGPVMGAFNDWVRGSFLEDIAHRTVQQIGYNLLEGAAVVTRANQLKNSGVQIPDSALRFHPRELCACPETA